MAKSAIAGTSCRSRRGGPAGGSGVVTAARSSLATPTFNYLVELGPAAAAEVGTFSTNGDPKIRAGVAEVLGIIGDQTSLGLLDVLSRDRNKAVAEAAARSQARLVPRAGAAARR